MVDRYQSIIEQHSSSRKNRNSSIILQKKSKALDQIIQKTQKSAQDMRKYIKQYREATTSQQEQQIVNKFRNQEDNLHRYREMLTQEYKGISEKENSAEKLIIKEQLLKTVQKELKLDVEMNELISSKQNQLEILTKKLQPGSQKLKNALCDLNQKRNQIIYLQEQVKQCVQLLQIIGILVLENTQKINYALDEVKRANEEVDKSLKNIELAKLRSQKARKRKCCIIIIGLIVIIVIAVVVFGVFVAKA